MMCRRVICLLCACALAVSLTACLPVPAFADSTGAAGSVRTHKPYRPTAMVSAMFLILAGMGVTMLFDKRD